MIPYCWLKMSHAENQVFQNQPLFSRMWKYAEDMACTIRIRQVLLRKEFGPFKYDTNVHIKRIHIKRILNRQVWGSCKYFISLSWFIPYIYRGVSLQNCLSIVTNEF